MHIAAAAVWQFEAKAVCQSPENIEHNDASAPHKIDSFIP